jgi:hypothetical protein
VVGWPPISSDSSYCTRKLLKHTFIETSNLLNLSAMSAVTLDDGLDGGNAYKGNLLLPPTRRGRIRKATSESSLLRYPAHQLDCGPRSDFGLSPPPSRP